MELHDQPMPERMKVMCLLDMMNVASHIPLIVAKQNFMDLHHDNWTNAMNYTSTKIAEFFPQKRQDTKTKGRFIYEANVPGRGGHERATGRGHGRGGHRPVGRGEGWPWMETLV
jgi:hypothetical protein